MVVVVGLFVSVTLPSFAGIEGASAAQSSELRKAQTLAAGEDLISVASERDSYTVSSAAENRALREQMLRDQNLAAYLRSGAAALGDDYPWPAELTNEQGGGLSPLRYDYRECVDFVAWRLNVADGVTSSPFTWDWSTLPPGSGNASQWKQAWIKAGLPTGPTPSVGSVAWFAGANHVAFVSGILDDGYVLVEEYNWNNDHGYSRRIIAPGDAYYLSAPPG